MKIGESRIRPTANPTPLPKDLARSSMMIMKKMKWIMLALLVASGAVAAGGAKKAPEVAFSGRKYLHRWSQADQHEFTPAGQKDLSLWTDMVTINYHRKAKDGVGLSNVANHVLANYKAAGAKVITTDSVPRTPTKPAEHLAVVVFGRPSFLEATFARLKIHEGVGVVVGYSHRIYGKKVGDEMSKWLAKNGPTVEKKIMALKDIPTLERLDNIPSKGVAAKEQ